MIKLSELSDPNVQIRLREIIVNYDFNLQLLSSYEEDAAEARLRVESGGKKAYWRLMQKVYVQRRLLKSIDTDRIIELNQ